MNSVVRQDLESVRAKMIANHQRDLDAIDLVLQHIFPPEPPPAPESKSPPSKPAKASTVTQVSTTPKRPYTPRAPRGSLVRRVIQMMEDRLPALDMTVPSMELFPCLEERDSARHHCMTAKSNFEFVKDVRLGAYVIRRKSPKPVPIDGYSRSSAVEVSSESLTTSPTAQLKRMDQPTIEATKLRPNQAAPSTMAGDAEILEQLLAAIPHAGDSVEIAEIFNMPPEAAQARRICRADRRFKLEPGGKSVQRVEE